MPSPHSSDLSIIIPILDEAEILPDLFRGLGGQRDIVFETILSDGGSVDGTPEKAPELAREFSLHCRVIRAEKGRGQQMNAGAAVAQGEFLLFLHADSEFPDPLALRKGMDALREKLQQRGDARAAGRFALSFRRADQNPSLPYYFYESKARLDRPGCIHGDQGFLLPRIFFQEIGPFDGHLPLFEDDVLAARIFRSGEWLLLPTEIVTSARRFEAEGLRQRQILNALLSNFAAIGWDDFFRSARTIYRQQSRTRALPLYPYFRLIRTLLDHIDKRRQWRLWYRTGAFVRANAWQIAFFLDVKRHFVRRLPAGAGSLPTLRFFERYLDPLIDHPPGRLAAAVLTWSWFHLSLWRLRRGWPSAAAQEGESHATGDP